MYADILAFWFHDIDQSQWWTKDEQFDRLITERFSDVHEKANRCELFEWRQSAQGRLAEVILLDQFSRNMFRESALAFAYDPLALALSQEAISLGSDEELDPTQRSFLYLPFMHSESLKIHEIAVSLYAKLGVEANMNFELKHQAIIRKFGRYPHRNRVLGRISTAEEMEFLEQPGSGF